MTAAPKNAYEKLKERFEKIINMENALGILSKDAELFMPKNSNGDRTRQMVALAEVAHALIKAPEVEQWLDEAEKNKNALSAEDRRNLHLMRREWVNRTALSEELVAEIARVELEGRDIHVALRKTGDWAKIKDWYAHAFDIKRAVGLAKKDKLGVASVYEALLDDFSPDLSESSVAQNFEMLEKMLPTLIGEAAKRKKSLPDPIPLTGPFPSEQQAELCRRLVTALGFDFAKGRLDLVDGGASCGGSSGDVRFTTNCSNEASFIKAVYSAIHEGGHALYEQNTPEKWRYQLAGKAMGMALHESQSRIMQVQACQTKEFFQFLEKLAREVFNRPDDPALSAENLERLVNKAEPSLIRIAADEVTYPAHIILRCKLEKALIEGTLAIDDLPKAWNDGMTKLLGITPTDAAQGCMQDVHWPTGAIGYFPAYTLGDMGAAQFFAAACKDKPEIKSEIANGNFTPLREWLRDNVHSKGSLLTTDELFTAATGEPLNAKYYLDHLSERYLGKPRADNTLLKKPDGPVKNPTAR
ncbi:MAG: carboxypeptidase M32 [Alphaproteobacteria bacterium]|nr:carboxypeptidase M32 [Alphaproteobacteria bacterium]